jgi:hypothetical protein
MNFITVSENANSLSIFLTLSGIYVLAIGVRKIFRKYDPKFVFLISTSGFILVFLLSLVLGHRFIPPLLFLPVFTLAFFMPYKMHLIVLPVALAFITYYSWFWYPDKMFIQGYRFIDNSIHWTGKVIPYMENDSLELMDVKGENAIDAFRNSTIIIETWNERCGSCIHAMKDLHPFLDSLEQANGNFKHYYLYTNSGRKSFSPSAGF